MSNVFDAESAEWRGVDGEAAHVSSLWHNNAPNNPTNQGRLCVRFAAKTSSSNTFKLEDEGCGDKRGYICEKAGGYT